MGTITENAEMAEYKAVVASGIFPPGSNAAHFLEFVCQQYFDNKLLVTEYAIAVEALGRHPDFDPKIDSIVRVEAHRVRKRLHEYYEHEGSSHPIHLMIPAGKYLPVFECGTPESGGPQSVLSPPVESPAPTAKGTRKFLRQRRFAAWGVALLLVAGLAVVVGVWRHQTASHVSSAPPTGVPPPGAAGTESGVRIACGRTGTNFVDRLGREWSPDRYFSGGSAASEAYRRIFRAEDPTLFLTAREGGSFSYDIPLQPGNYELRLYFAETEYGPDNPEGGGESSRMMTIAANGVPLLTSFDPLSDADGENTADERVFEGISPASDGKLHLTFSETWPNKANPFVNAIAITPNQSKVMQPIRWVMSVSNVVDAQNNLCQPDQFYQGGLLRKNDREVTGTADPELFRSSRFGNFSYTIPVPEGTYTLTLFFDEYWFGLEAEGGAGGGSGSRLFDVYCNGAALLRDFDILKNAGGPEIAISRTFRGLRPNAQGKLVLSFVPVRDYATLAALEVVSEKGK